MVLVSLWLAKVCSWLGGICHTCDNQSHPRLKDSPSCPAPLPSRLLQIAEITHASLLRTPYVIQHQLASPQPNLEHLKTSPERIQLHTTNLTISPARPGSCRSTRLLENLLKVPPIVTLLYLVPFHLCTLLFSSRLTIVPFPRCTLVFTFYV